jgi:hypothetical protein
MSVDPHTDLGFDPETLRAKYRAERDRRIRPDGSAQYRAPPASSATTPTIPTPTPSSPVSRSTTGSRS